MNIIFQRENYEDLVDEIDVLAPQVSYEVDIYPGATKPNIDHERLINLGDQILVITMRNTNSELVGFTVSIIIPDVLFKHVLSSYSVFYYVDPEYRGHGQGLKLFTETEKWYDELGVQRSFIPRKIHLDNQKLFQKLNYIPVEINYTKDRGN